MKKGRKKRKRYWAEQNRQSGKNPKEFMTECMAVQAQISDYIDGSLPAERMEQFVHHVEHCRECREELKIYYTLYLGILQLDREEEVKELSDLDGALEESWSIRRIRSTAAGFFRAALCHLYNGILVRGDCGAVAASDVCGSGDPIKTDGKPEADGKLEADGGSRIC